MSVTAAQPISTPTGQRVGSGAPSVPTAAAPIARLTVAMLASTVVVGATAVLFAWLAGGGDAQSLAYAGVAGVVAAVLSVIAVALCGSRTAFTWATIQIGLSAARLGVGLGLAVALYFAVRDGRLGAGTDTVAPSKFAFFGVFLAVAVAGMAAEVGVFRSFLSSMSTGAAGAASDSPSVTEPAEPRPGA